MNVKKIIFLFLLTIFSCNLAHAYTSLQNNATSWVTRTSAADSQWQSIAYGNGLFVAVASTGATSSSMMTSPDGVTWTLRPGFNAAWEGITYANGLFVAVAGNGSLGNRVMTSPDGINWTLRSTPANNIWKAVTYGNGLFVAVAQSGTGNRVMTSPDGINWTIRTSAGDYNWTSVTYANGTFVAVAFTNCGTTCAMTSSDGINWTIRTTSGNGDIWNEVRYGNGLFVAISQSSRVMTSPDGITWTERTASSNQAWQSLTYSSSSGLFVAVAASCTPSTCLMTSPDGITWTGRAVPTANNWEYVTFEGGIFVSVALSGTGNRVMTSHPTASAETAGGSITTTYTTSSETDTNSILVLAGTSTQVVAKPVDGVSYSVGNTIGTSTVICIDTTITPSTTDSCTATGLTNGQAYHLAIFTKDNSGNYTPVGIVPTGSPATPAPKLLLADGINPSNTTITAGSPATYINSFVLQTDDGTTNVASATLLFATSSSALLSLIEITNDSGTVVYGSTTNMLFSTSTVITLNTNTLTANTTATQYKIRVTPKSTSTAPMGSYTLTGRVISLTASIPMAGTDATSSTITFDNEGPIGLQGVSATSTWAIPLTPNTARWKALAFGNNTFVAVSEGTLETVCNPTCTNVVVGNTSSAMTSTDGTNWTVRTTPNTNAWQDVVYGNGLFVAVTSSSTLSGVMTSPDGITWTQRTTPNTNSWRGITYANGLFVAVSSDGLGNRVMTSPDGITWTQRTSATNNSWGPIAYGNGIFVTVSSSGAGAVMTSPDGITWTARENVAGSSWWNAITYGNDLFVAVASLGTNRVMTSPDGIVWTLRTAPTSAWDSITFANGLFVASALTTTSTSQIMVSSDGINWEAVTTPTNTTSLDDIVYGNNRFVSVGVANFNVTTVALNTTNLRKIGGGVEPSNNKITTTYTTSSETDTNSILVLAGTSTQVVAKPVDGVSYSVGNTIGTSTVICIDTTITPSTTDSCTATGLTNGQAYHLAIFTKDNSGNYTPAGVVPTGSPATPNPAVVLGDGTDPSNVSVGPGASAVFVDSFTFQTETGSAVISDVTIGFGADGATSLALVEVTNDSGTTVYGATSTNLSGSTVTIPLTTNTLTANTSLTQYKIRITPKNQTDLPQASAGRLYAVTAKINSFSTTINKTGSDTDSATVTVDNESSFLGAPTATQWTTQTSAADYQWDSVAYGNGIFAAVADTGTGNRIMTSPDGVTWTLQTTPADYTWKHIAFGNGIFVAVATNGVGNGVMTSTDGVTWTLRTTPADNAWHFVKYVNNIFVALAYTGSSNRIMTSPDGINWTIRTTVADNNVWTGVTYGNGTYVAVSWSGSANRVMTSPDGVTWTGQTVPSLTQGWDDVAYGNGLFVAVANTGAGDRVMTSPDGVNWTLRTAAANNNWVGILYVNGLFVAVSETGTGNRVMTSSDGINWTSQVNSIDNQWRGLAYGNGTFVAVAKTGTGDRVMTSRDATTKTIEAWTSQSSDIDNNWTSVTYGNGLFVAVANTGENNRAGYSGDGESWSTAVTSNNNWNSVTYGNGLFVAVADSGDNNRVMTSPNGVTWTPRVTPVVLPYTSVTYGGGLFVAVAETGGDKKVITSSDGINWTAQTTPNNANKWKSVTYGNNLFVAVANTGAGDRVMTSPDGINWTIRTTPADNDWSSVTYGEGIFVAAAKTGTSNRVMTSSNGVTWTLRTTPADNEWSSVTYGDGLFVATASSGNGNRVMTSPDGINWTIQNNTNDNEWKAITYGNATFVGVASSGNGDRVMTSSNKLPLIIPGSTQNIITYTNPAGSDLHSVLVLRSTSAVTDIPAEGTVYSVGNTIGSATVVCVDTSVTPFVSDSCTDTSLSNGQEYHYALFARDIYGNYSVAATPLGSPATPQPLAVINQAGYQLFASSTTSTPGTALVAQNTPANLTNSGQIFRMRMTLGISSFALGTSSRPFKLQFSPKIGTCDASFTGEDYKDINNSTPIAFYNVPTITSGVVLGSQVDITHGGSNIVDQTYNESNNFTNSQAVVNIADYAKFDFSLIDNNAPSSTSYCIRAIGADGSLFSSYSAIPEITTATQQVSISGYRLRRDDGDEVNATYFTTENGVLSSGFVAGDKLRIRFSLANQTSVTARKAYQLEYSSGSCIVWSPVPRPIDVTNQHFRMETSPFVADNSLTTHSSGMSVPGGRTFVPGRVQTFNSATLPIVLQANEYTELEYSVRSMGNVTPNTPYCFRLSNLGLTNDFLYTFTPQLTPFSKFLRAQAGGGGGGGASATIINIEEAAKVATTTVTGGTVSGGATSTVDVPVATSTTQQSTTTPTRKRGGSSGNVGFLYDNTFASAEGEGMVLGEVSASMCTNMQTRMLYGSTDSTTEGEVSQLQYFLKTKGYFNAKVTGNFFSITENAVKEFQKDNNLIVTGIVGKPTREKMQQLGCVSLSRN